MRSYFMYMKDRFKQNIKKYSAYDEMSINRRYILLSGYSLGVVNNLIGGNFWVGFLVLLQADDNYMGLLTLLVFGLNLLQLFSPLLLEKFEHRKRILILSRAVIYILNIVIIGMVSIMPTPNSSKLDIILFCTVVINFVNSITAPGYNVWHIKSIPENIRARFFSFNSITNGVVVYGAIVVASFIVDKYKLLGAELKGLLILRFIALFLAVADIYFLSKIKEYPNIKSVGANTVKSMFTTPFTQKKYLCTVIIACTWSFAANIPGPYFTAYMLKTLSVNYSYLNVISMLYLPVVIIFSPLWRRRIEKTSWFGVLKFTMTMTAFHYLGLALVTEKTMYLFPISVVFAFIFIAGINLVFANIPFINLPEENQTALIGFFASMNNLAALLGAAVGKTFITRTENIDLRRFALLKSNKQVLMLIVFAVMMICSYCITIIEKKLEKMD